MLKHQFFSRLEAAKLDYSEVESILKSIGGNTDPDRIPAERFAAVCEALRSATEGELDPETEARRARGRAYYHEWKARQSNG